MGLCSLHCPPFPLDMVKGTLLFVLVGCDFCHAVSLKHRALGDPWRFWAQAASSLAMSLGEVCTYRRGSLFYRSVLPSLSPLGARPDFSWNRVINLFSFVCLVLQSRSHLGALEGFAWPGNQTLWVDLEAGWPGAQGPWVDSSILTHWFFTRFALFPVPGSCSCSA